MTPHPQQIPLFFDSYEEAIRATIAGIGGLKSVGVMLRPELAADEAGRWLADCLNCGRREQLHVRQLAVIRKEARRLGVHTLAAYEAREAGYADPQPLVVEDESARLQREFVQAVKALEGIRGEMARLQGMSA